jgi:hypothetical protein
LYTTHTSSKRRGTASLFGTLIFIGILFSAVIPMYLVMNQADVIFEQEKHEVAQLDDEKAREDVYFYVYPDGNNDLMVVVENRCAMSVTVKRIWINEDIFPESSIIQPTESIQFGPYDVDPVKGDIYDIRVTTERGNVFECSTGTIEYGDGYWIVETKIINVIVSAPGVVFKVTLKFKVDSVWVLVEEAQVWKIGGSVLKPFVVTENGEYEVIVQKGSKVIHDETGLMMEWPDGPSILWVYS